jgi:hypothetical protein
MYYYTINGQMIPSKPVSVPANPGKVISQNVSMRYAVPAVHGQVLLTGAPMNFNDIAYMGVRACPGRAAFSVGCQGGAEAYEDVGLEVAT